MSLGSHLEKPGVLEATATATSHRCSFLLFENKNKTKTPDSFLSLVLLVLDFRRCLHCVLSQRQSLKYLTFSLPVNSSASPPV